VVAQTNIGPRPITEVRQHWLHGRLKTMRVWFIVFLRKRRPGKRFSRSWSAVVRIPRPNRPRCRPASCAMDIGGFLPNGKNGQGVKVIIHCFTEPRLRMFGRLSPFHSTSSCHGAFYSYWCCGVQVRHTPTTELCAEGAACC
jgi:hypothetical protein